MRVSPTIAALTFALLPTLARADAKTCIAASERGLAARGELKLSSAKIAFAQCASDSCPPVIRSECEKQLADVEAAIPTVVFGAKLAGRDVGAVRVLVDGNLVTETIDGRAMPFDPGAHVFRLETAGQPPIEKTVILKQGEKNRAVDADWGGGLAPSGQGSERLVTVLVTGNSDGKTPILEARRYGRWTMACSAPCEQPMAIDGTYRLNGDGVPTSVPFSLQAQLGQRISVGIKEGDDGGKKTGRIVTAVGGTAFLVGTALFIVSVAVKSSSRYAPTTSGTGSPQCDPGDSYESGGICEYSIKGLTLGIGVTGGILGTAGLVTLITGLVMLASGRAEVTQSKVSAALSASGFAF